MLRKLIKIGLKNPHVHAALKRVYKSTIAELPIQSAITGLVEEIAPIGVCKSAMKRRRLNLLVPALSIKHVFGGIATALHFFNLLLSDSVDARIILTDESNFDSGKNPEYMDWKICSLDDEDCFGKVIVSAGDRYGKKISIREDDFFVATAWWTASIVNQLIVEQANIFGKMDVARFAYLIQDFEPGFYPWSSRYALAESTYHNKNIIAIFNTSILKEYFDSFGYVFKNSFVFEPVLNSKLRTFLGGVDRLEREKIVLVYGRPGVTRNAFEVIVMALREAVQRYDCTDWKFYSAGESHSDIDLGGGVVLSSLGKLAIEEYGALLKRVYVGISLMVSPHPSYPPLEMAAFGIKVITNRYSNKDLSTLSPNISSVDYLSPTPVASMLGDIIATFGKMDDREEINRSVFLNEFVNRTDPFFEMIPEVRATLVRHG